MSTIIAAAKNRKAVNGASRFGRPFTEAKAVADPSDAADGEERLGDSIVRLELARIELFGTSRPISVDESVATRKT
jgi:hypothetical protein